MARTATITKLDERYSYPGASATSWEEACRQLAAAELYWLSTVRPEGRPHVTPLIGVWLDDAMYFCTGATERKALNLEQNEHCILTTGCNQWDEGFDVVVEGDAERVTDDARLRRLADEWETKYGSEWHFDVRDGAFTHDAGVALVFEVAPQTAFGFGKGKAGGQTRWQFA